MGNRRSLWVTVLGYLLIRFVFDYLQCLAGATSPPRTVRFTLLASPTSTPIPRTALGSLRCLWAMGSISTSLCYKQSPTMISSRFGEYSRGMRTDQGCYQGFISARNGRCTEHPLLQCGDSWACSTRSIADFQNISVSTVQTERNFSGKLALILQVLRLKIKFVLAVICWASIVLPEEIILS